MIEELTRYRAAPAPSIETPSKKGSEITWAETEISTELAMSDSNPSSPPISEKNPISLQNSNVAVDLESQTPSDAPTLPNKLRRVFKLSPRMISDAIIGISDGMTVPFALTAGLATLGTTRIVILAGLAELVAGAISMGLGGYYGAKSEAYAIAFRQSQSQLITIP